MPKRPNRPSPGQGSARASTTSPFFGLRYPLVAGAIAAVLFAIYFFPQAETAALTRAIRAYLAIYARLVGAAISLFEDGVDITATTIRGPRFSMMIVRTCDAMEINILLVAALSAFPMPMVRRLLVVPTALLLIVVANVARLCALYWLGAHRPGWFERAHQTLAPLFMMATALAIFWLAVRRRRETRIPRPAMTDGAP